MGSGLYMEGRGVDLMELIVIGLMKKIDVLQKFVPPTALPILNTLQLLRRVQTRCFGWDLCPDYKERIHDFIDSVKKLQVHFREVLNMKSITIP